MNDTPRNATNDRIFMQALRRYNDHYDNNLYTSACQVIEAAGWDDKHIDEMLDTAMYLCGSPYHEYSRLFGLPREAREFTEKFDFDPTQRVEDQIKGNGKSFMVIPYDGQILISCEGTTVVGQNLRHALKLLCNFIEAEHDNNVDM